MKKFEQLPQDEQEDFLEVLKKFNETPEDFTVNSVEFNPSATGGKIRAEVSVRSIKTGKEIKFQSGNASNWIGDFEKAMAAKSFD